MTIAGRKEEAQASYAATGLSATQCAALDSGPQLRRTGADSSDFPDDAMRWGFEGWTATEFDVAADGRTSCQRVVAAYPPEIFADASRRIMQQARYTVSYRPGGDLACTGESRFIRFAIP